MSIILFDSEAREHLLPLTFTRPIADLRIGILTIREKWEKYLNEKSSTITVDYLSKLFPAQIEETNLLINATICPDADLLAAINKLETNEALVAGEDILVIKADRNTTESFASGNLSGFGKKPYDAEVATVTRPWDIFKKNKEELEKDFKLITKGRQSLPVSSSNTIIGTGEIFLEESAKVEASILNTTSGPIYIGKDAEIMEGSMVRGPLALCEHSALKLGTKIYGPTTVGPHSKVGGEVNNSVIIGYSNKGHDGFLGNSVLGEWVNIGADSNNSNLKNNYDEVRLWNYRAERFEKTGLQFCGLIMGDHSKCGINTMFNTGTVVGVSANVFGAGFPRNFIPSYSWGGAAGFTEYKFEKAMETSERMMERRGITLDENGREMLKTVYDLTKKYRNF